jgi:predicted ribosome quality control (RQC) complex YloA/Tae2 family protein
MSFYDLLAWLAENSPSIVGCRIDNVSAVSGTEAYDLRLYCKDGYKDLILEPGRRVFVSKVSRPLETSGKVTTLRSLVRERTIRGLETLGSERILKISLSDGNSILLELLPRGVMVVVSPEGKILFASESREMKDRVVRPGVNYSPPPQPTMPQSEVEKALRKGDVRRLLGVPQEIAEALGLRATNPQELEEAKRKLEELVSRLRAGEVKPCYSDATFAPIPFPGCKEYQGSFNDLIEEFFSKVEQEERERKLKEALEAERKKLEATIEEVRKSVEAYEREAEELRAIASEILSEYPKYEAMLQGRRGKVKVQVRGREVELDPALGVNKSVGLIFDKAKELESKAKKARETLEELKRKLSELDEKILEKVSETRISVRKKEWYERFRWSFTRNNMLVLAGIDADQNESLVKKYLEPKDVFLHADIQGAAATVLKCDREPTEEDILDAATIAAAYSKAWKVGLSYIEVFWVKGDQVSKSPPSGEYLPKGSFMIYGKKNFLKVPLELYLCIEKVGDSFRPFVGSESSVRARCDKYVKLVPGDDDPSQAAEKVIKVLQRETGISGLRALKKELEKMIPGKSKVVMISK